MQLAGSEHIGIHVALCSFTKILVFLKDLPVEVADVGKLLIRGVLVAVHFVLDLAGCRRSWHHTLNVEKVVATEDVSGYAF